jgi:hypothetical protein
VPLLTESRWKFRYSHEDGDLVERFYHPNEQAAIEEGYDLRAQVEQQLAAVDLTPPDESARKGLELLAWMVANGYLDVKVAVPVDLQGRPMQVPGIYPAKFGIILDRDANTLAFSGSINETAGGWKNNCESFHTAPG